MINQEQIARIAKPFGNGAHVFVPKEWVGEQILVIKPQKKSINERILSELAPYLDNIVGIYLYGSYARNEQTEDSDIDIFVITNEKIKIKVEGFEIVSLRQEDIEKAIKIEPLLIYSILSEAKPIINSKLIDELRTIYKPKIKDFEVFISDSMTMLNVCEESLKLEKSDYLTGDAVIYSLVLRLRGLFIIKSILANKKYSHNAFKSWIKSEIPKINFSLIYEAYKLSKNDKKVKQKIKVSHIKDLLEFLKKELLKL